jgi:hypothetical protein
VPGVSPSLRVQSVHESHTNTFFAASNLGEPLLVDAGKIVVCDQKTLQTVVVDNEEGHYDMDAEKWVVRALKLVSFESHVPALPAEPLSQKVGDDLAVM